MIILRNKVVIKVNQSYKIKSIKYVYTVVQMKSQLIIENILLFKLKVIQ